MTGTNPYSYLFGPFVALVVVVVLVFVLRWAFGRGGSLVERTPQSGSADQYGLLVPIATPSNYADGELLRRALDDAGVRATLASTEDGPRLMVFPADETRARALIAR